MKRRLVVLFVMLVFCIILSADTIEEIIVKAESLSEENLSESVELLEEGLKSYPESADLYSKCGVYLSRQAGNASFMKAGILSEKAFKKFNKALEIEPGHAEATLYRGILGVNMPKFLGKLEQGIKDLEYIQENYGKNQRFYLISSYYLGEGLLKNGKEDEASEYFKFVMLYGRDSSLYEKARAQYEKISDVPVKKEKADHYQQGMRYLEENDLDNALIHLRAAAKEQPENLELQLMLAKTLGDVAERGYDESIKEDVTERAGIAHEIYDLLNHCVQLAPDNEEIRFLRGSVSVNLPFFVNSLETGISDLRYLAENSKNPEMIGKSRYLLQEAENRKQVFELAEAGYNAESEEDREKLRGKFISTESKLNQEKPEGNHIRLELILGYRDQIEPQTAVWVEDMEGNFLATIYVSDFAASVKEKQVHLPQWAKKSKFRNTLKVTGASIDCGKHEMFWDMHDINGNQFKGKQFVIKAEICHWPHVQYRQESLNIDLEKGNHFISKGDNYLIFEMSAAYVAR